MKKAYLITVAVLVIGVVWYIWASSSPGPYDEFAKCLAEKGARFYGAFWCPQCAEQKKLFGRSINYVNYIECSTSSRTMKQVCAEADINGYPTWIFSDSSRAEGVQSLHALAEKTGCQVSTTMA